MVSKTSVPSVLSSIAKPWNPKLVAKVDGAYDVRVAKIDGEFIWHAHPDSDELFYILQGSVTLELDETKMGVKEVVLNQGDIFVVPTGVRHRPVARQCEVMLFEKSSVINTGDVKDSERTVKIEDVRNGS